MNARPAEGQPDPEVVHLCPDGVYRWYYEMPMLKNPTILFTVWKVLGIAFCVPFLLMVLFGILDPGPYTFEAFWSTASLFLILAGVFLVISVIAYLIVAASYGWKYAVFFEMDEHEIRHIQAPKQSQRAEALGQLTALVGAAAGKPAVAGLGLTSGARNTSTSEFRNVRTVKLRRRRHTIHVNQLLNRNQVYVSDGDFDFVADYILARCTNLKKRPSR